MLSTCRAQEGSPASQLCWFLGVKAEWETGSVRHLGGWQLSCSCKQSGSEKNLIAGWHSTIHKQTLIVQGENYSNYWVTVEFLACAAARTQASRQASLDQTQEYRVNSASLHPSSVCPIQFDKIIHLRCITICPKKTLGESSLSRFSIIKSSF